MHGLPMSSGALQDSTRAAAWPTAQLLLGSRLQFCPSNLAAGGVLLPSLATPILWRRGVHAGAHGDARLAGVGAQRGVAVPSVGEGRAINKLPGMWPGETRCQAWSCLRRVCDCRHRRSMGFGCMTCW
jgi:hypothetical protein